MKIFFCIDAIQKICITFSRAVNPTHMSQQFFQFCSQSSLGPSPSVLFPQRTTHAESFCSMPHKHGWLPQVQVHKVQLTQNHAEQASSLALSPSHRHTPSSGASIWMMQNHQKLPLHCFRKQLKCVYVQSAKGTDVGKYIPVHSTVLRAVRKKTSGIN